jgi:pyruvate dehydrogenase E1 component alpha subunit
MGHSMSDPGSYRTRAEIEKYQERDPVKLFSSSLKEKQILTDQDIEKLEKTVRDEVEQALRFAEESPLPAPEELYTDVYANPIIPGKAQAEGNSNSE